jgi:hypothetical protein
MLRWPAILACYLGFVATTTANACARELTDVRAAFAASQLDSILGSDLAIDRTVAELVDLDRRATAPSLVERMLVAEGASPQQRDAIVARLESLGVEAAHALAPINADRDRCIALHAWLHAHVLTGKFKPDCHRLSDAVSTGNFNCFTATALYTWFARECRLSATPVLAAAHVFVRVTCEHSAGTSSAVDVETTCPGWFRAAPSQQRAWLAAAIGRQPGEPREISDTQLAGVYFYNQGVEAFRRRDFADAARLTGAAIRFDASNQPACDNLLAALNNLALQHAAAGETAEAERIVDFAMRIAGDRADLRATHRYLTQREAARLAKSAE